MRTRITMFLVTAAAAATLIAAPAEAQHRGGGRATRGRPPAVGGGHIRAGRPIAARAVRRPSAARPGVAPRRTVIVPSGRAHIGVNVFGRGLVAYGYPSPGYYRGYPGGYYGGPQRDGHARLRLLGAPRNAEVYVDGYYAGIANDFDGVFQHLELTPGPHQIEIRAMGFAPVVVDVQAVGGRTTTYRARMAPNRQ